MALSVNRERLLRAEPEVRGGSAFFVRPHSRIMLSIALQIVMFASFIALLVLIWRVSKWPRWRVRAVIYGWGASILLAGVWAMLMPWLFRGVVDAHALETTFPDGTLVMGMLAGGWMWPLIVVGIASNLERRKRADDHVA